MKIRTTVFASSLALLTASGVAYAQHEHRATVLTRGGERVSGSLEDVEGGVVYVRVSLNDQRKLPLNDVALIDLAGGASGLPDTETNVARGSNHLALLRGGDSLQGQFVDVRGGEAGAQGENHILIFRTTSGEERRISMDNVSRIYLGNFPMAGNSGASVQQPSMPSVEAPAGSIRVAGNTAWTATSINVRRGDRVRFNATGQVQLSDNGGDVAQSAGSVKQRYATGSPLPQNFAGALIGRIGNSAPFPIGNNTAAIAMPADGQLWLGVNDDEVGDNRGEFFVQVMPQRGRR